MHGTKSGLLRQKKYNIFYLCEQQEYGGKLM